MKTSRGISTSVAVVAIIVVLILVGAAAYYLYASAPTQGQTTEKTFKIVMFETVTSSDPYAIANAQGLNQAVKALNNTNGYVLKVTYVYSVSAADIAAQMTSYANQGYNLIIPNDATYDSASRAVVAQFPNIQFYGGGGFSPTLAPNLGAFSWDVWRGFFEAGVVAGAMTKTGTVGFVTGFSFGQANEGVNAFWLGANLTYPHVKIVYTFAQDWVDATKGAAAANSLVSQGADVVAGMGGTMSTGVVTGAANAGAYGIGYLFDTSTLAPSKVVTSVLWNTTSYYTRGITLAQAGALGGVYVAFTLYPTHISYLAPLTNVPADKAAQVNSILAQITSGKLVEPEITTLPAQGQAA